MRKMASAALAGLLLATCGTSVAVAETRPDHQDGPPIERGVRDLKDVPVIAGTLEQKSGEGNYDAVRIAGRDRYETAALISEQTWSPQTTGVVFLASGTQFPDALAVGQSFAGLGPLLLADAGMPFATVSELQRLRPCVVVVVGGADRIPQYVMDEANFHADSDQAKCNQ